MRASKWFRRAMAVSVLGTSASFAVAQAPVKAGTASPIRPVSTAPSYESGRPVAYVYGNVPITMEEFGKYLMDRGGVEKLELFVNKRIIELEAEARKVTVTKAELEASLAEDLKGIGASQDDFLKILLPKYGKTLYEWMEDVVRPRILLSKMCMSDVKVTDEDLKKQFEREFGEKRRIQMMMWPKSEEQRNLAILRAKVVNDAAEFDTMARAQMNPSLAASAGKVKPIGRHMPGEDKSVEEMTFKLKVNEVSEIMNTPQGYVMIKLLEVINPDPKITFETEKVRLYKGAFEDKLAATIPLAFSKFRDKAAPQILYTGPSDWTALPPALSTAPSITTPGTGGSPTTIADPSIRPAGGGK